VTLRLVDSNQKGELKRKNKPLKVGDKITLTVVEIADTFFIAKLRSDKGDTYISDLYGKGPLAWQDPSIQVKAN